MESPAMSSAGGCSSKDIIKSWTALQHHPPCGSAHTARAPGAVNPPCAPPTYDRVARNSSMVDVTTCRCWQPGTPVYYWWYIRTFGATC